MCGGVRPDGLVEGRTEELTAVLTEAEAGHSFTVGALKPSQTLSTLDLPHLHTHTHIQTTTHIAQ